MITDTISPSQSQELPVDHTVATGQAASWGNTSSSPQHDTSREEGQG